MPITIRSYKLDELSNHPWQVNIPDITGKEWTEFLADIRERGVQDPITVSMRTGVPVIVDGHQRVRAARECGYELLEALEKPFADEGEEIERLFSSAVLRRHLTPHQMAVLGEAYEKVFAAEAEMRMKSGKAMPEIPVLRGDANLFENVNPKENFPEGSAQDRQTRKRVADKFGISDRQYDKIKTVHTKAPEPVKQAWRDEQVSTHAAYTLTKSPEPIQQALDSERINIPQAIALEKNKEVREQIEKGVMTIEDGISAVEVMKKEKERVDREQKRPEVVKVDDIYHKIEMLGVDGFREAHESYFNKHVLNDKLADGLQVALEILNQVKHHNFDDKELTVEAVRLN